MMKVRTMVGMGDTIMAVPWIRKYVPPSIPVVTSWACLFPDRQVERAGYRLSHNQREEEGLSASRHSGIPIRYLIKDLRKVENLRDLIAERGAAAMGLKDAPYPHGDIGIDIEGELPPLPERYLLIRRPAARRDYPVRCRDPHPAVWTQALILLRALLSDYAIVGYHDDQLEDALDDGHRYDLTLGYLPLPSCFSLVRGATAFLTVPGGFVHLACAVGSTPTLALWGCNLPPTCELPRAPHPVSVLAPSPYHVCVDRRSLRQDVPLHLKHIPPGKVAATIERWVDGWA